MGFHHVTSSPRYPQAKEAAERAVQTAKNILKKNTNPYLGLLAYRTAPLQSGLSPSQLLMSRRLRTNLPTVPDNLAPELVDQEQFRRSDEKYKTKYTNDYNKRHKVVALPCLSPGDKVFIRDQARHGEVVEKLNSPRSYKVTTENGNIVRRNRRSLIHIGMDKETEPMGMPTVIAPTSPRPVHSKSPSQSSPCKLSPPTPHSGIPKVPVPSTLAKMINTQNNQSNNQTTRSGRAVKTTQKPDMVYFK